MGSNIKFITWQANCRRTQTLLKSSLQNILTKPVKIFQAEFTDLSYWNLEILSSDGMIFKTITGKGNPPQTISWDGMGENNDILSTGQQYMYRFIAVDEAGNKRTYPGHPFSEPAVFLQLEDKICISIAESTLFSADSTSQAAGNSSFSMLFRVGLRSGERSPFLIELVANRAAA